MQVHMNEKVYPPSRFSVEDLQLAKRTCVTRYLRRSESSRLDPVVSFHLPELESTPRANVVGVGISDKVVGSQLTGETCIKIYVRHKFSNGEIGDQDKIPGMIEGIPTDVEEVGDIRPLQMVSSGERHSRLRPAPCGVSVGHPGVTAGTIGALVRNSGRQDDGRRYILSNNHVLANANNASIGDPIFQPGRLDGGIPLMNQIGHLARFVPIRFDGGENKADCALAEVDPATVLSEVCSIGVVRGTVLASRNMIAFKHGRTTGLTRGVVTDIDADIRVDYPGNGEAFFTNTIVVRGVPPTIPFSDGGDSGSIILDSRQRAVGLLFAGVGARDVTFANPIRPVLRKLRMRLV